MQLLPCITLKTEKEKGRSKGQRIITLSLDESMVEEIDALCEGEDMKRGRSRFFRVAARAYLAQLDKKTAPKTKSPAGLIASYNRTKPTKPARLTKPE